MHADQRSGMDAPGITAGTIVGRGEELAAVASIVEPPLRQAMTDEGATAILLEGEPGIGKTTLWRWAADRARSRHAPVLSSRPAESEAALAYAALGDLLEPVLERAKRLPAPQKVALDTALGLIEPTAAPVDRLAVSRATLSLLRAIDGPEPVVIAIDDIQWLDGPTAAVIEYCVRRIDPSRLRMLLTRRVDAAAAAPFGLDRLLLPGRFVTLHVGPLQMGDLDELIRSIVGVQLSRPRLVELHRITGGNPYFALELARAGIRSGQVAEGTWAVPRSLRTLLGDRLGRLASDARTAVLLAAASAHPTTRSLRRAAAEPEAIDEAVRSGVLVLDGARVRFTHPLLGSVAYDIADPWDRRDAHRRLAESVDDPEERALHLASITDEPDPDVVVMLERAADRAAARGAPEAAAHLREHAVRLSAPGDPGLLERTLRTADHHLAAGDTDRARHRLDQAAVVAAPGATRARILCRLGQVATIAQDVPAATELFRRALDEAAGDAALEALAMHGLAFTAPLGGDVAAGVEHAEAAHRKAQDAADRGLVGLTLGRLAVNRFLAGNGLDRDAFQRALALEAEISDAPVEWLPSYGYATVAMFADEFEIARSVYASLHDRALALDDERVLPALLFQMAQLECWAGDWRLAERHAGEAVERSRQSGQRQVLGQALYARALVDAHLGRVESARAACADALRIADEVGAPAIATLAIPVLGFLELSLGDHAAAHARLAPIAEMVVAIGAADPGIIRFLPDDIEALILMGRPDDAEKPLAMLEERGRRLDRISARAAAARCRALLALAKTDIAAAEASIAEALDQHARLAQPFELARTLLAKGSIERRAKRRSAARQSLSEARDAFHALGAILWEQKAEAELARISGRAPGSSALTDAERRVAELVAEGRSNREVGAALFVTERTVEGHLSRVYAKLDVRSRTELARRMQGPPVE